MEEKPKVLYPAGHNLSAIERKLGSAHNPLDRKGKVLCYNFSAHAGCGKGGRCLFSHDQRIRPEGLRWAAQYDIARRGGLSTGKRIDPVSVDGYLQALRTQNGAEMKKSIEESRGTVGRRRTGYAEKPPWDGGFNKDECRK